jgi:2-methylcitrate dehydratase PrpD
MSRTDETTIIERLAANTLETRFEDLDQEIVENAKTRIIDTVGCLIGGANDPSNPELVSLIKDYGGKEEATILIHGGKVPAGHAAMVNSIMCRSFDFEPIGPLVDGIDTPGHISGTTVMTAVSMSEATGASGREMITALTVGDDVASRILAASGFGFNLGWDGNGTANAFGATAIAGRLLDLSKTQMINAFGLVLNQLGGSLQNIWDGTPAFKLPQGLSARNGIFSAQLAKAGWTGPDDALFGQFGYFHLYTEGCRNPELLDKDLGKRYYSDGTFKIYPCCRKNHAAIDCALAITSRHAIRIDDIQEIILYVTPGSLNHICGHTFRIGKFPHANAAFSLQYTVATALLKNGVRPEHFIEKSIRDPEVIAVANNIKLVEWPESETKLNIIMKDGREIAETCRFARGDSVNNAIGKDEIIAKFWNNVEFSQVIPREKVAGLLNVLEKLDEIDDVDKMVQFLTI